MNFFYNLGPWGQYTVLIKSSEIIQLVPCLVLLKTQTHIAPVDQIAETESTLQLTFLLNVHVYYIYGRNTDL